MSLCVSGRLQWLQVFLREQLGSESGTNGQRVVETGGLWGMVVMHSLFPSPQAISLKKFVLGKDAHTQMVGKKQSTGKKLKLVMW